MGNLTSPRAPLGFPLPPCLPLRPRLPLASPAPVPPPSQTPAPRRYRGSSLLACSQFVPSHGLAACSPRPQLRCGNLGFPSVPRGPGSIVVTSLPPPLGSGRWIWAAASNTTPHSALGTALGLFGPIGSLSLQSSAPRIGLPARAGPLGLGFVLEKSKARGEQGRVDPRAELLGSLPGRRSGEGVRRHGTTPRAHPHATGTGSSPSFAITCDQY